MEGNSVPGLVMFPVAEAKYLTKHIYVLIGEALVGVETGAFQVQLVGGEVPTPLSVTSHLGVVRKSDVFIGSPL